MREGDSGKIGKNGTYKGVKDEEKESNYSCQISKRFFHILSYGASASFRAMASPISFLSLLCCGQFSGCGHPDLLPPTFFLLCYGQFSGCGLANLLPPIISLLCCGQFSGCGLPDLLPPTFSFLCWRLPGPFHKSLSNIYTMG